MYGCKDIIRLPHLAGIGHVDGNIEQVFKTPEQAERETHSIPFCPKGSRHNERDQCLIQSPSKYSKRLVSKNSKYPMTRFMKHQINIVRQIQYCGIRTQQIFGG